jgi:GNAT superfamily N-acetyltransferase
VNVEYRPLAPDRDYPAVAALMNLVASVPVTPDLLRQWAERADPGRARQQIVAVDEADQVIGVGDCVRDPWMPVGQFWADVIVDPAWRMHGIGAALFSVSEAWAVANGALYLGDDIRGDQPEGRRFAEARGFKPVQHTFEYRLDLPSFSLDAHAPLLAELEQDGYRFFSYEEAGDTRDHRKAIYKLNKRTVVDDWSFVGSHLPYAEYCKRIFEASWARHDELIIAAKGELWVGFTQLADFQASGMVVSVYTGVEREYRKQGLATALIALSASHARSRGVQALRISMDGRDETMQGIAERLGAAGDAGAYRMVKTLPKRPALHGKN